MRPRPLSLVIDPGHGGPLTCGAMWPRFEAPHEGDAGSLAEAIRRHESTAAAVEKRVNLEIAQATKTLLEASGWPIACHLTRETDEALTLTTRAEIARKYAADVVLAIHCDTAQNPDVAGLWTYVKPHDNEAFAVAKHLMLVCPPPLRRASAEPKIANPRPEWTAAAHAVLARHSAPAVLVECGFVSADKDRAVLTCAAGQAMVAAAIVSAVAGAWRRRELSLAGA